MTCISDVQTPGVEYKPAVPMPTFKPTRVRIAFAMALFVLGGAGILVLHEVSRMLEGVRQIAEVQMRLERLNGAHCAELDGRC